MKNPKDDEAVDFLENILGFKKKPDDPFSDFKKKMRELNEKMQSD